MTGGSDILVGDMPVERGAQGGQVQVAVDAAVVRGRDRDRAGGRATDLTCPAWIWSR